jgi:prophage regulatory protein
MVTNDKPPRLLRLKEVTQLTSLGKSAIYARVAAATFPQPLTISSRCSVWREDEVVAWANALPRGCRNIQRSNKAVAS